MMSRISIPTLAAALLMSFITPADATPLDDQLTAFSNPQSVQTEASVSTLLATAIKERRCAEAMAKAQPWLSRNHLKTQPALLNAAQAAEFSGQWQMALGYYQTLLQNPKVDRGLADVAVGATYRLLLNALKDENAAYLFMRRNGNRIRTFGQAKRYDRWFLDKAKERRDLVVMCDRLATISNDRTTTLARFTQDFEWLCSQFEAFRKEDPTSYVAAIRLASANPPPVFKARLQWAATVMPYNLKLDELRLASTPADPKLSDAPLAAAAQLLNVSPDEGAILVAKGWGVEYDHGHSGNCQKRFEIEGERKLAQLLAAVPRMSPSKRADLLAYQIAQNRVKLDPTAVRKLVIQYPGMLNTLTAVNVPLFDASLTVEEAKTLAPQLARNPHAHAALVRAKAATGSDKFSELVAAVVKSEMWRFDSSKSAIDTAWNSGVERDAELADILKQYEKPDARFEQMVKQTSKTASSKDRLAAFAELQRDLIGSAPTVPGGLSLWDLLFVNATDADLSQMLKVLVADTAGERGTLLRRALSKARFGKAKNGSMFWQAEVYDNQFRYHRTPVQEAVPDLIAHLQDMITKQAQAGTIDPMVFGMWLHTVDPRQDNTVALIQKLIASPAYLKLDPSYHAPVADSHHFGMSAATPAINQAQPQYISRELLALPKDAAPNAVEAAFNIVAKRAASLPDPVVIVGLEPVAALPQWSDQTRLQVLSLFRENAPIGVYPNKQGYEPLIERLADNAREQQQWDQLEPYFAGMWQAAHAKDHHTYEGVPRLIKLAEAMLEAEQMSLSISIARNGLASTVGQSLRNSNDDHQKRLAGRLSQVTGKSSISLGIIDIPVHEHDPAYAIYKSQSEFALGNLDAAWELYDKNAEQLQPVVRQLTVQYCLWLLDRNVEYRDTERSEALVKELTIWSRQDAGRFTAQQEADLKISYADIAFQKGALQTSRAWYRRVADAAEHQGTEMQYKAALRSVMIDRVSRNFGTAITELDKLMLIRDANLRIRVHFARAEVFFDQEKYADAYEEVSRVLKREPSHPDALILLGKSQLEMRKLVDASNIELGASRDQKLIVPGEAIKINLSDPTLSVSGVGADIEVEIWAESGDRERVMLHQLGDDKTKFRAEVQTQLAAPRPGDKVLQVLGRDKVRYGYSQRFRAKMSDLPPDPQVVIGIASDARLDVSAGAFPPRKGERRLNLEELGLSAAQQALGTRQVRPGNPIYLRVFDPDQSKTAEVDEIMVDLTTSSGDLISSLLLKETGTHTGEFEAIVQTGTAQALAFASETAPGRDANMVISATPYPGWSGAVGSKASETILGIDLNDNVPLDKMTIQCADAGQVLTHFVLQTSMNGQDWTTRARYPDDPAPWDGRPRISSFPTYGRALPISVAEDRNLPEDWAKKMEIDSAKEAIPYNSITVTGISNMNVELASGGHPGYPALIRYRALFYQPAAAIRTFRLNGFPAGDKTQTIFLLDGQPAGEDSDDPLSIQRELAPGLHEIQVWRNESRGELLKRTPQLLCDASGKAELILCPDSMFDPSKFPEPVRKLIAMPATIKVNAEAGTQFDVAFGANSQGRLVRLVILDHEGVAPSISKITLTDREGTKRLPVDTDYQRLRNNEQLEVIPGDQITVRYEDDLSVTPRRVRHQQGVGVAYNTATISASFLNYITTEEGRELVLEDIRRFKMDDSVAIVINDADMDQGPTPDRLSFSVAASGGEPVAFEALETGPHTGVFLGRVFPVTSEPKRASEIQVSEGGTLTATYRDMENLDPGIPTDRNVTIEHARYRTPTMAVFNITSKQLTPPPAREDDEELDEKGPEIVRPRRSLHYALVDQESLKKQTPQAVIGSNLRFDVVATHLAFAESSSITAYVQTDAGRKAHGSADGASKMPFDVRVPGTLKLTAQPGITKNVPNIPTEPLGYVIGTPASPPSNRPPLDEGRFSFTVPLILEDLPTRSYATEAAESLPSSQLPDGLAVRAGDVVHIGFAYKDQQGKVHWQTAKMTLESHAFLDVMDGRYRRELSKVYVGEKLFVRLIAPGLDRGPDRDVTTVSLKAASGATTEYQLRETSAHSGDFKGSFALSYATETATDKLPSVELRGFPVKYGDEVVVSYRDTGSDPPPPLSINVNKGANGAIESFSKQYSEDGEAVKTTFTLAECFFELAKHHRKMDQESLARREMSHAQKLLAEAIATHQDDELKAHAEYLLGNLAQEYADLSKNEASKRLMYQDALARFSKIPLDYPEAEFAPKAQFKKALVYEKMGEVDIAVEEYVKLAYKYPDNELIPSVMSRLGSYFQKQGLTYKKQAEELEKKEDDVEAAGEALRLRELATKEYLNAATVFAKLQERFPEDPLAGLAGLRSAQNYMRAGDFTTAIVAFQKVIDTEEYDGKDIRAQAVYWCGLSQERLGETMEAYELYRRTTFDFPDSVWAKYARGRLADPAFAKIIKVEEEQRANLLNSLKNQ